MVGILGWIFFRRALAAPGAICRQLDGEVVTEWIERMSIHAQTGKFLHIQEMIRAIDEQTGKVLWQSKLPAGGYATPATYLAHSRQFLVITCGGGKMGTRSGDAYVAFALPERGGVK